MPSATGVSLPITDLNAAIWLAVDSRLAFLSQKIWCQKGCLVRGHLVKDEPSSRIESRGSPLAPSQAFPEIAKFLEQLFLKAYPCPRRYYLCAPRNLGPDLHDLLADPVRFRATFVAAWQAGTTGLKDLRVRFTPALRAYAESFDFGRIQECLVRDLIGWHAVDRAKHFSLFGIEPDRGTDPTVPFQPASEELKYVAELVRVYNEHSGRDLTLADLQSPSNYGDHLATQRSSFYCAEGLRRFSRDLYSDDEFGRLLDMVHGGLAPRLTSPRLTTGMDRLDKALDLASTVRVDDSPLRAQLRGGDLPGACHHLVNEERLKWVR